MTRAAWEWRMFAETPNLLPEVNLPGPTEEREEYDLYLVAPGLDHNVKVRSGGLEIKRFLRRGPSGMQLWQDKESFPLPLALEKVALLGELLGADVSPAGAVRPEELVPLLRRHRTDLVTVAVWKRRYRWTLPDGCRLETAMLTFPGGGSCWSFAADGYEFGPVLKHAQAGDVSDHQQQICGYVELLQKIAGFRGEGERPLWATSFHSSLPS